MDCGIHKGLADGFDYPLLLVRDEGGALYFEDAAQLAERLAGVSGKLAVTIAHHRIPHTIWPGQPCQQRSSQV